MKYYKAINLLEANPNAWDLLEVENFDEIEIKKINTEEGIEITNDIILSADLDSGKEETDYHLSVAGIIIVSDKLRNLLYPNEAKFFPVKINNLKTKQKHYALRITNFYDCVDEKKSEVEYWTAQNTKMVNKLGNYKTLNRFVIDKNKAGDVRIFRLKKYSPVIIIREDLKKLIEENGLTGIGFANTL